MWRRLERGAVKLAVKLARRKRLSILLVGLAPLILRALLLPLLPVPNPRVHDEFSNLLVADTFAHGRLVNPAHPLSVHFESMHILVRPVYASIFPVAQGLILAAGQVLTGIPWIGVWVSIGFMCAALCWMLQGWVSPGWALLGGALAVTRYGIFSYWMNSYYGGAMAAAGGALVLGALPRILRRRRWQDAALLGVGFAVLANSRPYEGLIFSVPVVAALFWKMRANVRVRAVMLPLVLILGATVAAMCCYFARFSGNPLLLPYAFYRNTVAIAPHFIWQSPRAEPVYHHRVLHHFYTGWEMGGYRDARAGRSPHGVLDKALSYWRFYLGPLLTIPFVTIPWLWKRRRTRLLLLAAAFVAIGLAVEVWHIPHYAAPATGLALLLVIEALRQFRQGVSAVWFRVVVVGCFLTPVIRGNGQMDDGEDRARILNQLESSGGSHVVLVRYNLMHDPGDEWVYNAADIDGARVVWAREMDPTSNRNLVRYFEGRRFWLVRPDARPVTLAPYDLSTPPDPPFRFVKLGTGAIEALRSPDEVRRRILDRVDSAYAAPHRLSCDQWNYFFTDVTGVEPPNPEQGCFPPGKRDRTIEFDEWFRWLEQQR